MICLECTVRIVKQTRLVHYLGWEESVTVDWCYYLLAGTLASACE